MKFSKFEVVDNVFRLLCGITALSMVIYWIVKYQQNIDQDSIYYEKINQIENFKYPELSICVADPYFKESFEDLEINITTHEYHNYLVGKTDPNSVYRSIDFNNISINLTQYIKEFKIRWSDDTSNVCNRTEDCAFAEFKNSFNGFWYAGPLFKCNSKLKER